MKHWDITIKGKVQGVYFRLTTKAVADHLGIKGFVMNQPDGTVYIEAEGNDFALESLLDFCEEGPEHATVEEVVCKEGVVIKGYNDFVVLKKAK